MTQCIFDVSWIGRCKNEATDNNFCFVHHLACASCGAPAIRDCDETGQLVCGAPLCDGCEHTTRSDGTNGGIGFYETAPLPAGMRSNVRKTDQVFKPWYM